MGDFTDLVCIGRIFLPNLSGEIFPPTYNGVRFFFQHCTSWAVFFFSAGYFSPRNLFACFFPLEISLQDIFSGITHNPSKVKWSAPKIHQTFGQLTDSDLSIISEGFWNNRGQNSLGESTYGRSYGRTYGDVITKFSGMDSLPNFITHGSPLGRTGCTECTKCNGFTGL